MRDTIRDKVTGKFIKILPIWTPEHWDKGWFDNCGRFRVYRPDYPRAYSGGYALRAHIVWWLATGVCHPTGTSLHHVNGMKSDDRLENLMIIPHGQHSTFHNSKAGVILTCLHCEKSFKVPVWRITQRLKEDASHPKFCSLKCYYAHSKSDATKMKMSQSMRKAWAKRQH